MAIGSLAAVSTMSHAYDRMHYTNQCECVAPLDQTGQNDDMHAAFAYLQLHHEKDGMIIEGYCIGPEIIREYIIDETTGVEYEETFPTCLSAQSYRFPLDANIRYQSAPNGDILPQSDGPDWLQKQLEYWPESIFDITLSSENRVRHIKPAPYSMPHDSSPIQEQ